MITIGSLTLGDHPRVAGIIDRIMPVVELEKLTKSGVDLFEVRVDLINQTFETILEYLSEITIRVGVPLIGTIRENERTVGKRISMFRELVAFVDAIDVELGTPESEEILANADGVTIIISEHDYQKTPSGAELKNMVDRAVQQGAHIVKLAVMANSREDVLRLLEFTRNVNVPVVSIAMGPIGTVTRVIAPLFGSLFTFGFIGDSVAPGQLPVSKLIEEIRMYYPVLK